MATGVNDSRGRIVLVMPTTSYRADDFVRAALAVGADLVVASDRCHVLDKAFAWPESSLVIDFYQPDKAVGIIVAEAARPGPPVRAVVAAGGEGATWVAAAAATRLGLAANPPGAAAAARSKRLMREALARAGVAQPAFRVVPHGSEPGLALAAATALGFPVVVKPLLLSASRGVMRADDAAGLATALARLGRLLATPELAELDPEAQDILIEAFVPGREVALEGLLSGGELATLALFDKPDPLDGPFFEETLYVTPSREPADVQAEIQARTAAAARAMGLTTGPVHAELRLGPGGPTVIEVAARTIGGLCARTLRFGTGLSLEELVVRHALGEDVAALGRERAAAGVMMIPIPARGVLTAVTGREAAAAVPGVEEVVISAALGAELRPLPEGASYLGFIFARGNRPETVEQALRDAHRALTFQLAPLLPTL